MTNTYNFALPLIQAAQAQKHVTVNEALARMDAIAQMRLIDIDVLSPPVATDGAAYGIGIAATGDWAGQDGDIAIFSNGSWVFLTPKFGWKAWNETTDVALLHDGIKWHSDALALSPGGAATFCRISETVHVIAGGTSSTTGIMIPKNAMVLGITARVEAAITGTGVSAWTLGIPGAPTRYGYGIGLGKNSFAHGVTGAPITYYADTPLVLSTDAGNFIDGTVRLAVHFFELGRPRIV